MENLNFKQKAGNNFPTRNLMCMSITMSSCILILYRSYSQYNGKLMADSSEGNSSSLLGSFGEQFKSAEVATSNSMLDQIPGLTKSAFTSLKQVRWVQLALSKYN